MTEAALEKIIDGINELPLWDRLQIEAGIDSQGLSLWASDLANAEEMVLDLVEFAKEDYEAFEEKIDRLWPVNFRLTDEERSLLLKELSMAEPWDAMGNIDGPKFADVFPDAAGVVAVEVAKRLVREWKNESEAWLLKHHLEIYRYQLARN